MFWIDRTVPEKYRPAVRDGILEWNKAFEKIGFKDAIVVKQQDADAIFDTYDSRHSTVRWFVSTDAGFAIGPSTSIRAPARSWTRRSAFRSSGRAADRTFIAEQAPSAWPAFERSRPAPLISTRTRARTRREALAEMQFGLDVLFERGDIEPGSPEADAFVAGDAQGRRHARGRPHARPCVTTSAHRPCTRSRRSPIPTLSREHGISGSVMDYNPFNIAVKGESAGRLRRADDRALRLLGDRVRVQAAAEGNRERRAREDRRARRHRSVARVLVGRGNDRGPRPRREPVRSRFRSARLPAKRLVISQELWQRLQAKQLKPGESYDVLRRSFDAGFRQFGRAVRARREVRRRRLLRPRLRRHAQPAADAGFAREAARRIEAPRHRRVCRRQLPVQAGVHAQHGHRLSRTCGTDFTPARFNPDFSLRNARARVCRPAR